MTNIISSIIIDKSIVVSFVQLGPSLDRNEKTKGVIAYALIKVPSKINCVHDTANKNGSYRKGH